MAGIFLSWSAADEAPLNDLKRQLESLGIPIWEYSDKGQVGQQIHGEVLDAIQDSLAAIICFTDATADAKWLKREIDWAYAVYGKDSSRILPVWIGPHPDNKKPALVDELSISVADLTRQPDRERFVREVLPSILALPEPLVVPAALFAMDEVSSARLFDDLRVNAANVTPEFPELCKLLGMVDLPPLLNEWKKRYGKTVDDFSPFDDKQPLKKIIQTTVDDANLIRRRDQHRPIYLRWMHSELLGAEGEAAKILARDRWRTGNPLLIIDSISTLDPNLVKTIDAVVERRSAILWIPPYTLHTNALEGLLRQSAVRIDRIGDAFRDWEKQSEQQLAFDAPTSLSVRLWLHRTFIGLEDLAPPVDAVVSSVQSVYGGPRSLKGMTGTPRNVPSAFGRR